MFVRITEGRLEAAVGSAEHPDVVFRMSEADYFGVLAGTENPDILFMDERIRVDGDLSLALKLRTFFGSDR
jgi:predicted lipid carrier protein YhbT